jgi:hypothetical protein
MSAKKPTATLPNLSFSMTQDDIDVIRAAMAVLEDKVLPQIVAHKPHGRGCGIYSEHREVGVEAVIACLDWLQDGYEDTIAEYAKEYGLSVDAVYDEIHRISREVEAEKAADPARKPTMMMVIRGAGEDSLTVLRDGHATRRKIVQADGSGDPMAKDFDA